ncbi:MAG: hypothetical protein MUC88_14635 [Planctomycetes bacterium]|nr:hypothetical protein [Planctomycetota bacterium]
MVVVWIELFTFGVILPEVPPDATLNVFPEVGFHIQFREEYADSFNVPDHMLTQARIRGKHPTGTICCVIPPQPFPQQFADSAPSLGGIEDPIIQSKDLNQMLALSITELNCLPNVMYQVSAVADLPNRPQIDSG